MIRSRSCTSWLTVLLLGLLALTTGCAGSDDDTDDDSDGATQRLDEAQANALATVRFQNYQAGTGQFSTTLTVEGEVLRLHGIVDWRSHVGSAVVDRAAGEADLLQWSFSHLGYHQGGGGDGLPPAPPSDGGWRIRALDPSSSSLDTVLTLILNLGADRPENPELLRSGGARFVETTSLDGVEVDVFSGPTSEEPPTEASSATSGSPNPSASRTRFWIDSDGLLRRFEVRLGGSPQFVAIDLDPSGSPEVEMIPDFPTPADSSDG